MKRTALCLITLLLLIVALAASAQEIPTLRYNSQGDAVTALQERLADLGYYTFRVTGVYQENTQRAVREFQADNGLEVTGIADADLQSMILGWDARPKATPTPAPTMNLYVAYPGRLEYGSTGEDVARVQSRLAALGFYTVEISGNYMGNTRNAVRDFQAQNGLKVDGVVGEETWQALFFSADVVDAYATPKPTPTPTPVPYHIGVDLTNQVTTVYSLDETYAYTIIEKQMICSTGTASDPTPAGSYTLNGKKARWCYFPKWGTHAQYWTRIDAYNAFHSVIYSEVDEMSLKTSSYTGLGKVASHGCIRLMVADAKWIYDNCGAGTVVEIYEGAPDEELTKSLKVPPLDYSVMLPQTTAAPTASPVYSSDELPPMPFTTLKKRVESEDVYWLQCRLTELGYYTGTITGGYYSGTVEAVKAYQRDNGLTVDGAAGKNTLNSIYAEVLATPSPSPTAAPTPTPTPAPTASPTPSPSPTPTPTPTYAANETMWFFTATPAASKAP